MRDPVWLSRPTDSSRLVEQYRVGRVFLAGDSAHVHWAYGGKGMQSGLQDAGNLGWKLAAEIHGWAPPDLLDTYHSERHPVGRRLMRFSRAHEALARPGEHVTACASSLLDFWRKSKHFERSQKKSLTWISVTQWVRTGVSVTRYSAGGRPTSSCTPSTGKPASRISCALARGVLLDLAGQPTLKDAVAKTGESNGKRHRALPPVSCENLDAMLIRPDGYVAWIARSSDGDNESCGTLGVALQKWFGKAR